MALYIQNLMKLMYFHRHASSMKQILTHAVNYISHIYCTYILGFRKASIFLLVWQACFNGITPY